MSKKILLLNLFTILLTNIFFAQTNIGVKIIPFGINSYSDINAINYTTKLTSDGFVTFEPGFQFSGEYFGKNNTSIKFIQEFNRDQMKHLSGFSQILVKYKYSFDKHNSVSFGIGPNFHFRKTWADVLDYQDEGIYKTSGKIQYKANWFSGEIEYNHYVNKKKDFSISVNHLHPNSIGIFFGYTFWITRRSNHCQTCPSFH